MLLGDMDPYEPYRKAINATRKIIGTFASLPPGSIISVHWTGTFWPPRPTDREDVTVVYIGGSSEVSPTDSIPDVDIWLRGVA